MNYPDINHFIDALLTGTTAHICLHDLSGLTDAPLLRVRPEYTIHSRPFCDHAKTTRKGLSLCLRCKGLTIRKAMREKTPFMGHCPFGALELVHPLLLNGETAAILYLGNLSDNSLLLKKNIFRSAKLTESNPDTLLQKSSSLMPVSDCQPYQNMLSALAAYIYLLKEKQPAYKKDDHLHWAVRQMLHHIEQDFARDLTLSALARLYHMNEQYAGRLFKNQTGFTFHQYLNRTRLEYCARMLRDTDITITEAAYQAGYNHVTYFNRMFIKHYHQTPKAYRQAHRQLPLPI